MNFINRFFVGNSKQKGGSNKPLEENEVMVDITSVIKDRIPEGAQIIAESKIPAFCMIGNLIFEKKYHEAIELGNKLLEQTPYSAGVHVNLMDAYFKVRDENPTFSDKCIEHARLAMLYGQNTGYVQERLAISLEKQGKINQALQICNIVLLDKFQFSRHGCGNKDEFLKRKGELMNKINKAVDKEDDVLFTNDEISKIIDRSHEEKV
jgi:tetratricopeptide (TPR) repeat protein